MYLQGTDEVLQQHWLNKNVHMLRFLASKHTLHVQHSIRHSYLLMSTHFCYKDKKLNSGAKQGNGPTGIVMYYVVASAGFLTLQCENMKTVTVAVA